MNTKKTKNFRHMLLIVILAFSNQGCIYPGCEHHDVMGDALNTTSVSTMTATKAEIVPNSYPVTALASQRVIDLENGRPKTVYSRLLTAARMKRSDSGCDYWISTEVDLEPVRKRLSDLEKNLKELSGDEIKNGEKISTSIRLEIRFRDGPSPRECGIREQYSSYIPVYYTKTIDLEVHAFQKQDSSHEPYRVSSLDEVKDFIAQIGTSVNFENTLVGDVHYEENFKLSITNQVLGSSTSGDCS